VTDEFAKAAFRPRRIRCKPTDECCAYLLEVFEVGAGPIGTGTRHAVWLRHLRDGSYRWKCSCGASRSHGDLDAALLAEARAHFDQVWESAPSPIWHPVAVWNDRASGEPPPSAADIEQLARDFASEMNSEARPAVRGRGGDELA